MSLVRRAIFGLTALLVATICSAQNAVTLNWARTDTFAGGYRIQYNTAVALPNGNFVVGGSRSPVAGAFVTRGLVRCFTPGGVQLWETVLAGPNPDPSLFVQRMMVLPDSSIYLTAFGGSGLVARLNSTTGAVTTSRSVPGSTNLTALTPDGTAFFAQLSTESYDNSTPDLTSWLTTRYFIKVVRVSNTLVFSETPKTGFADYGSYIDLFDPTNNITWTLEFPKLRFVVTPTSVHLVMAAMRVNSPTNVTADEPALLAIKFLPDGTQAWSRYYLGFYPRSDTSRIITQSIEEAPFGRAFDGAIRAHFVIRDGTANTGYSFRTQAVLFPDDGGDPSTVDGFADIHHTLTLQNGFAYGYELGSPDVTSEGFAKYTAAGATLWKRFADEVSRLPFQFTTFTKVGATIETVRRSDATSNPIDTTIFNAAPDNITDAVENPTSGDGLILGNVNLASGKRGGWIARYSQAPTANGNTYTTPRNTVLNGASVLANDRFAGGLTPEVLSNVRNGTLVMNANGTFVYTPRAGYAGSDSFTYRIYRPGILVFSTATVFITVTP